MKSTGTLSSRAVRDIVPQVVEDRARARSRETPLGTPVAKHPAERFKKNERCESERERRKHCNRRKPSDTATGPRESFQIPHQCAVSSQHDRIRHRRQSVARAECAQSNRLKRAENFGKSQSAEREGSVARAVASRADGREQRGGWPSSDENAFSHGIMLCREQENTLKTGQDHR